MSHVNNKLDVLNLLCDIFKYLSNSFSSELLSVADNSSSNKIKLHYKNDTKYSYGKLIELESFSHTFYESVDKKVKSYENDKNLNVKLLLRLKVKFKEVQKFEFFYDNDHVCSG